MTTQQRPNYTSGMIVIDMSCTFASSCFKALSADSTLSVLRLEQFVKLFWSQIVSPAKGLLAVLNPYLVRIVFAPQFSQQQMSSWIPFSISLLLQLSLNAIYLSLVRWNLLNRNICFWHDDIVWETG